MQQFGADYFKMSSGVLESFLGNDAAPALVNLDKSDDRSARLLVERTTRHSWGLKFK